LQFTDFLRFTDFSIVLIKSKKVIRMEYNQISSICKMRLHNPYYI